MVKIHNVRGVHSTTIHTRLALHLQESFVHLFPVAGVSYLGLAYIVSLVLYVMVGEILPMTALAGIIQPARLGTVHRKLCEWLRGLTLRACLHDYEVSKEDS